MKKFYLKIWLLALVAAFAAIPAAAAEGLDYLLKTKEEKDLAIACDSGDGKYSTCTRLVEILSKKCDSGDYESCGALGILLIYLRRDEDAIKALNKACDSGLLNFCLNAGMHDLYYTGNTKRAFVNLKKVCDAAIEPSKKKLACKMSYGLEPCLNDDECNPVKKAKELF